MINGKKICLKNQEPRNGRKRRTFIFSPSRSSFVGWAVYFVFASFNIIKSPHDAADNNGVVYGWSSYFYFYFIFLSIGYKVSCTQMAKKLRIAYSTIFKIHSRRNLIPNLHIGRLKGKPWGQIPRF